MKLNKELLTAAIGLGFAGVASAACDPSTATHIYVTGSTAFRGATIASIEASLDAGFTVIAYKCSATFAPYPKQEQTGSYQNYYGTLATDHSCVIIKCAWSGAEAGYQDIVKCTTQKENFMSDGVGSFGGANHIATASPPDTADSHLVDIAMGDTSQPFAKPTSRSPAIVNNCKAGIVPFVWVKNAQFAADVTAHPEYNDLVNVTHPQLRVVIQGGTKLSLLTGKPGQNKYVYASGRDNNSGTRANTLLDLGYPVTQTINQSIIGGTDGAPTLGALGNGGQSSGNTLGNTMQQRGSLTAADTINGGTGWIAITYMGKPDALIREGIGETSIIELTLNGVAESVTAIEEGQYSFWGNEYLNLANCDTLASEAGVLYTSMCSKFGTATVTPGLEIPLSDMHCSKTPDSADPVHN